jgi:hypothetical protein
MTSTQEMVATDQEARQAAMIAVLNEVAQPRKTKKLPSIKSIQRMMDSGYCRATDGCVVEPDGACPHGKPSWALELGMI